MCLLSVLLSLLLLLPQFDPWFNFRTTRYLVEEGFYAFHNCQLQCTSASTHACAVDED
jgi:hypothetical protein